MKRILISAAEPSGDLLGAALIEALKAHQPIEAWGLAGPRMRQAGVRAVANMEDVSAMGLIEVMEKLGAINAVRTRLFQELNQAPDAVILIDAPDLHLPVGRAAKKKGLLSIGYVSPQVWAWRPGRTHKIEKSLDCLLCLFEFEPGLYQDGFAKWVGHPIVDRIQKRQQVEPWLFGLTPGSREQETDRLLPVFIETAERIKSQHSQATFKLVSPVKILDLPPWITRGESINDLAQAQAVLTKSGTVTLELAAMGVPQVVAHKVHPLTHWLGRRLVSGIEHIAMPNILSNSAVVPEFLQDLNPEILADALLNLPAHQAVDLTALGPSGASARAALVVSDALGMP